MRGETTTQKPAHNPRDKSMVSPENQGATFVELFFDLVFVFAITQITHYAAHHLDGYGILRSLLIFWIIWWGWTQFTWSLNSANTEHHHIRLLTLIATGVALVMAVSVKGAFSADIHESLMFAASYVAVRVIGLGLFLRVVFHDAAQRKAVMFFALLSIAGLVMVLVGAFLDPSIRLVLWLGVILLDLVAGWFSGNRQPAGIHAGHFAERHGLIVIIALGESLIVAATGLSDHTDLSVAAVAGVALAITCLLWWTYFGWIKDVLEEQLAGLDSFDRTRLARDAYTFAHFPLISGIIALAVGFEASLHPSEYTTTQVAAALGVGLFLFLVSTAAALWRAKRWVLWNRLIILAITLVGLVFSADASVRHVLIVTAVGLALIVVVEQMTTRRKLDRPDV